MNNELPERINVMKVVSYDVAKIVADLSEDGEYDVTLWSVMQQIESWVENDFSCGHGHTADTSDLIFQDENGEDLEW